MIPLKLKRVQSISIIRIGTTLKAVQPVFYMPLELQDMNALNKIVADYGIQYGSGSIFSMNTEYWDNPR